MIGNRLSIKAVLITAPKNIVMDFLKVLEAIGIKVIDVVSSSLGDYAANRFKRISIPVLALVVLAYQFIGTLGEWAMVGNFALAFQDFRIGIPGMGLQILGGYLFIKYLVYK